MTRAFQKIERPLLPAAMLLLSSCCAIACSSPEDLLETVATKAIETATGTPNIDEIVRPPVTSRVQPADCPQFAPVEDRAFSDLVRQGRYGELDPVFDAAYAAYEANPLCEERLRELYEHVEGSKSEWIDLLTHWIDAYPDSSAAYAARGAARIGAGYRARGTKWAKDTPTENFERMREYFAAATEDLFRSIELQPGNPTPYVEMLQMLKANGGRDQIESMAAALLDIHPSNYGVRFAWIAAQDPKWGGSYAAMDRIAEAAQPFADENPRLKVLLGFSWSYRAHAADDKGETALAIEHMNRALVYGDSDIKRLVNRLSWNYQLDNWPDVERDATWLLEIPPENAWVLRRRAVSRLNLGKHELAIADIDRALEIAPDSTAVRRTRIFVFERLARWEDAANERRWMVDRWPTHEETVIDLVDVLRGQLGRAEEAEPVLLTLLLAKPGAARGWYALGQTLRDLDRADEARLAYRNYLARVDETDAAEQGRRSLASHFVNGTDTAGNDRAPGSGAPLPGLGLVMEDS